MKAAVVVVGTALVVAGSVVSSLALVGGPRTTEAKPAALPAGSFAYNEMAVDVDADTPPVDDSVTRVVNQGFDVSINVTRAEIPWQGWQASLQYDRGVLEWLGSWRYTGLGGTVFDAPVQELDTDGDTVDDALFGSTATMGSTTNATGQAAVIGFRCLAPGFSSVRLRSLAEDPQFGTYMTGATQPIEPLLVLGGVMCEADADGDGMPDSYEDAHACLDSGTPDALDGPDADGLSNIDEFGLGTDPCAFDTDGDGCGDGEEVLYLGFDPLAWYDVFDVPVPARPDPEPNGSRNGAVSIVDVLAVLFYGGAEQTCPTVATCGEASPANSPACCTDNPNGNGVDYDIDKDGDTLADGRDYDRIPGAEPNPPWEVGPPNEAISIQDVLATLAQASLICLGPATPTPTPTQTATMTLTPTITATPTPNPAQAAIDAAIEATIDLLGWYDEVVSVEPRQWPDTCLGLPGEVCALVITPGYRITIRAGAFNVVWRTNLNGSLVRLEGVY